MELIAWLVVSHGVAVLVGLYLGRWCFRAAIEAWKLDQARAARHAHADVQAYRLAQLRGEDPED